MTYFLHQELFSWVLIGVNKANSGGVDVIVKLIFRLGVNGSWEAIF